MTFNEKIFWFSKFSWSSSLSFSLKIVIIKSTLGNRKYLRFHYIVLCYCHIKPPPNNPENAISFSLRKPSSFPYVLMSKLGEVFSVVTHSLLVNNDNLLKFLIEVFNENFKQKFSGICNSIPKVAYNFKSLLVLKVVIRCVVILI